MASERLKLMIKKIRSKVGGGKLWKIEECKRHVMGKMEHGVEIERRLYMNESRPDSCIYCTIPGLPEFCL